MLSLLFVLANSASITISATVVGGCDTVLTSYLQDDVVPQEDLFLTCNRGNVVAVRLEGSDFMQQASFNQTNVHNFTRGGTVHVPLPRASRGVFVTFPQISRPPRTLVLEIQ